MYKNGWNKQKVMEQIRKMNLGEQAVDSDGECQYRGEDENGTLNCCLVGAFIPEDKYIEEMEGQGVKHILSRYDIREAMPLPEYALSQLQTFHDTITPEQNLEGEEFYDAVSDKLDFIEQMYNSHMNQGTYAHLWE